MSSPTFNPKRYFVGAFIPNWMLRLKEVTQSAKIVYGRLIQYCDDEGKAWPKIDVLAEEVGISARQCGRVLTELEEMGFLVSRQRGLRQTNEYVFLWHSAMGETPESLKGQIVGSCVDIDVQSGTDIDVHSGPDIDVHSLKGRQEQLINTIDKGEETAATDLSVQETDAPDPVGLDLWEVFSQLQAVQNGVKSAQIQGLAELARDFHWVPPARLIHEAKRCRDHYGPDARYSGPNTTFCLAVASKFRDWLTRDLASLKAEFVKAPEITVRIVDDEPGNLAPAPQVSMSTEERERLRADAKERLNRKESELESEESARRRRRRGQEGAA